MGTKKASKIMNIIITATAPIAITTILTLSVFSIQDSFPFITSDIQEQAFAQTTTDENNQQIDSQVDRPEATAGNVTADIKPQGTTLGAKDKYIYAYIIKLSVNIKLSASSM